MEPLLEVDQVFRQIGEFGPAQWRLFILLSLPTGWMALTVLAPNFIATDPGWNCSAPAMADTLGI